MVREERRGVQGQRPFFFLVTRSIPYSDRSIYRTHRSQRASVADVNNERKKEREKKGKIGNRLKKRGSGDR